MSFTLDLVAAPIDPDNPTELGELTRVDPVTLEGELKRLAVIHAYATHYIESEPSTEPSGLPVDDFTMVYAPMLVNATQHGIDEAAAEADASDTTSVTINTSLEAEDGPKPSILNEQGTWDPLPGASIELSVTWPSDSVGEGMRYFLSYDPSGGEGRVVERVYELERSEAVSAEVGAVVFFSQTRGEIKAIRAAHGGSTGGGSIQVDARPLHDDDRWTWYVSWDRELATSDPVRLSVKYSGDPPFHRGETWIVSKGGRDVPVVAKDKNGLPKAPPSHVERSRLEDLVDFGYDFETALSVRRERLRLQEPVDAAKRFFLELEQKSHPRAGNASYTELNTFLTTRYWVRADRYYRNGPEKFGLEDLTKWEHDATHAGDLLVDLMTRYLSDGERLNYANVDEAFARFASGDLLEFDNQGVPDGTNIFCFAELAILLIELGHDTEKWTKLLPIFGRACEIYVAAFHDGTSRRSQVSYHVENLRDVPAEDRQRIDQSWRTATDPEARYTTVVSEALVNDLVRPADLIARDL